MIKKSEIQECAKANDLHEEVVAAILRGFKATWEVPGELGSFSQWRLKVADWGEDVMLREAMSALESNMMHPDVASKYQGLQGVNDIHDIAWSDAIYIGAWLNELFCFG